jgi:hypothetical protein
MVDAAPAGLNMSPPPPKVVDAQDPYASGEIRKYPSTALLGPVAIGWAQTTAGATKQAAGAHT